MDAPPAEELLRKIRELEAGQAQLKQEMSRLKLSGAADQRSLCSNRRSHSISPQRSSRIEGPAAWRRRSASLRHSSPLQRESRSGDSSDSGGAPAAGNFSDKHYLNILQSMGQSVHMFDLHGRLVYWNKTAEKLYGYSPKEALGQDGVGLLCDPKDHLVANTIIHRVSMGENWTGQFPVLSKTGERFVVVATNTPVYDDDGALVGVISVCSDARPFHEIRVALASAKQIEGDSNIYLPKSIATRKFGLDSQRPLQATIASKITNLASKVSNKVKSKIWMVEHNEHNVDHEVWSGDNQHSEYGFLDSAYYDHREDATSSGASTPRGEITISHFGVFSHSEESPGKPSRDSGDEGEGKPAMHKIVASKAEVWLGKKGISCPWKGNEREGPEEKATRFAWPWSHNDKEDEPFQCPTSGVRQESKMSEIIRPVNNEASGSWSSCNVNSTSSASSCGSTSSSAPNKVEMDTDCLDYEIMWEELTIGEQIGQGSCGTVYHGLWYGSDVAVKAFSKLEYSDDVILSFRQEVSLMKRLRHPNVLLFMGAVTLPERLCIVTEFLPRGSLFRLLQRNTVKLDWRRRIHMALDIVRGMNYLHRFNPPIIHRDLKTSNLLVDKNWTVKVGDFGLSRLKHETYLTTKTGKGTPQWMAPEVLRNEPADEKSDIYSFGVVLWELVTEKVPWENLNSIQVIGAVGFMNQRMEIPENVDPQWASLIESCWQSDPQSRPSFQELLEKLKDMQRKYSQKLQAARASDKEI